MQNIKSQQEIENSNALLEKRTQIIPQGKKVQVLCDKQFIIDTFYQVKKIIGIGAYGIVAAGTNLNTNQPIAIKKVFNIFRSLGDTKRVIRQMHILKFLKHKNIISLLDIIKIDDPKNFNDIYLVFELMESNLASVIRSNSFLTQNHIRFILYQILNGLNYMHSADIIHRDLKPDNIFINKRSEVKIGDLNLARKIEQEQQIHTDYVVQRWYRAPEVLLSASTYTKPIDIWSVGCILAELIGKTILFKGKDYIDQYSAIIAIMGKPSPEDFQNNTIISQNLNNLIKKIPPRQKANWKEIFPKADPMCLDLLDHMLVYNPLKRYSTEQCLNHPYLQCFRRNQRPKCQADLDWSFDYIQVKEQTLRNHIYQEACNYRIKKRMRQTPVQEQNTNKKLIKTQQKQHKQ